MYLRGATTCQNTFSSVEEKSVELFDKLLAANKLAPADVSAVLFTVTPDVTAYNPCTAVRKKSGLNKVAFMCMQEAAIDGGLPLCIRVLVVTDGGASQSDAEFVYLGGAANLRK